jgi:hypothetical protein
MTTSNKMMPPIRHNLILQTVNKVYSYAHCYLLHIFKPHSLPNSVCTTAEALG